MNEYDLTRSGSTSLRHGTMKRYFAADKENISNERMEHLAQGKVPDTGKAPSLGNRGYQYGTNYSPLHHNIMENKENGYPARFDETHKKKIFSDSNSLRQVGTKTDVEGSASSRLSVQNKRGDFQVEKQHRSREGSSLTNKSVPRSQQITSSTTSQATPREGATEMKSSDLKQSSLTAKKTSVTSNDSTSNQGRTNEKNVSAKSIEQQKNNESDIPTTIVCNLANVYRKFTRGKMLGKGGFAKCYLATESFHVQIDPKNQAKQNRDDKKIFVTKDSKGKDILVEKKTRYFALKIVSKQSVAKSKARTRQLQTEIRVHRALLHQHIVRFESCFTDDLNTYILLELCHNHSMSDLLRRRKYLTEFEVKYYVFQLVDALTYLYEAKVIHRDLKLGNLFLDRQMRIKVGDFGLSASLPGYSIDDRRNTVCGTPNYIAPEILAAKGHSFEVDMWSLGVIIYTLLVGKPPYESKDVKATYKRILNNDYSFPTPPQSTGNEDNDQDQNILKKGCESNSKRLKYNPPQVPILAQNLIGSMLQLSPKHRPLPQNVGIHPYLFGNRDILPASLPTTATQLPPQELIDEYETRKHVEPSLVNESLNRYVELIASNPKWKEESCKKQEKQHPSVCASGQVEKHSSRMDNPIVHDEKENVDMKTKDNALPGGNCQTSDYSKRGNSSLKSSTSSNVQISKSTSEENGLQNIRMEKVSLTEREMKQRGRIQIATESLTKKMQSCSLSEKKFDSPESLSSITKSGKILAVKSRTPKVKLDDIAQRYIRGDRASPLVEEFTPRSSPSSTKVNHFHQEEQIKSRNKGKPDTSPSYPLLAPLKKDHLDSGKHSCPRSKLIDRYSLKATGRTLPTSSIRVTGDNETSLKSHSNPVCTQKQQTNHSPQMNSSGQCKNSPSIQTPNLEERKKLTPSNKDKKLSEVEIKTGLNTVEVMHAKLTKRLSHVDKNHNKTPTSVSSSSSASLTTSFSPLIDLKDHEEVDDPYRSTASDKKATETPRRSRPLPHSSSPLVPLTAPKTWVCRYADYTSKYGLGFLMNNGSAGVLFNDATKIVVCPHNKFVRYIERISASNNTANEHTFLLESYPPHLHKKTTLLIHFRDFLIKDSNFASTDYTACDCQYLEETGAKAPENKRANNSKTLNDLVYVKKWIRTEQALLFRLSNRSVQLLFSDKTELLLSSEARIVTYLDENNKRETFHLSSIMADEERGDVVKKLKYTKDVLHLLVHGKDNATLKAKSSVSSSYRN